MKGGILCCGISQLENLRGNSRMNAVRKHPNLLNQNTFMDMPCFSSLIEAAKGRQNDVIT